MSAGPKRIVLAVTSDVSIALMEGFPELLVERGWEVHLVSAPGERLERYSKKAGIETHSLAMRRDPSILTDAVSLIRWFALLRRVRPFVLSVGTPKASLLALAAAAVLRIPERQYIVHGLRLETASGLLLRVLRAAELLCMRASTDVIAVSASLQARIVEMGLAPREQVAVLGAGSFNGVDISKASVDDATRDRMRRELKLIPGVPVVGYLGRLAEDKGIPEMCSALVALHRGGVKFQLLAVGAYEDVVAKASLGRARAAGVHVVTPGWAENPMPYLAVMDVFSIPSRREGFGLSAIEASAVGVPIVATEATGLVDAVDDGVTGLLSGVGDVGALARNLRRLLEDSSMRTRMGIAGRVHASAYERGKVQALYADRIENLWGRRR